MTKMHESKEVVDAAEAAVAASSLQLDEDDSC
jgi:hypothetical protein